MTERDGLVGVLLSGWRRRSRYERVRLLVVFGVGVGLGVFLAVMVL